MLEVDEYLKSYKKEISNFIEQKDHEELKITGNIFDRLVKKLATQIGNNTSRITKDRDFGRLTFQLRGTIVCQFSFLWNTACYIFP